LARESFYKHHWIDIDRIVRAAEAAIAERSFLMLAPQFRRHWQPLSSGAMRVSR
jgi:hypothetical protein